MPKGKEPREGDHPDAAGGKGVREGKSEDKKGEKKGCAEKGGEGSWQRTTEGDKGKGADEGDWGFVYRNPFVAPPDPRMEGEKGGKEDRAKGSEKGKPLVEGATDAG